MEVNGYEIKPSADLEDAYLKGANLWGVNLKNANLRNTFLENVDLEGADLEGADLLGSFLEGANLKNANLKNANLTGACLQGANLDGANFEGAVLTGTILDEERMYIPDNDTIEELIGEELTDEKKRELDEMRNSPAYPDEMFEAAQREEDERIARKQVVRDAMEFLHQYEGPLKELVDIERKELIEELEAKKKENFQKVADYCMEEYRKRNGERREGEYWIYMVADYFATGEGQTNCLMVTQALARGDDFGEDRYRPITTKEYRAVREFHQQFGTWMLHGLKFLSKEEFYSQYAYYIPPVMMKLSNANCYKHFHTQVHYNFS